MTTTVLILRWAGSAYDSLGGLLDLMAQELAALGLTIQTCIVDQPNWREHLAATLRQANIAFALTMSGIGTDLEIDGKLIWETAGVPLFNWSCDHPCYFPARHAIRNPYLLYGYVFPDHARYHIRHLHPNGAAFAVHSGIPPRTLFPAAPLASSSRNGRILFAKSGGDTNRIEATWRAYSPDMRQIMFAAAEALSDTPTADYLPTLQPIAERHGLFLAGDSRLAMRMIRELDDYHRVRRANIVMHALRRYPVDVFGTGWDHIGRDNAAATFHGPATWRQLIDRLPNHVASISINPLIEDSAHDRVFFALAAAVPPLTDANRFTQAHMPNLAPYSFDFTRERIAHAVENVLTSPEHAIALTNDTWTTLAPQFAMRDSVRKIVQFVMLQKLNAPCSAQEANAKS